jgi:CheY-like chemotaxis protein
MNSLNILLIEDDMIEIMKMKRVMASLDLQHTITEANNGEEALVSLSSAKVLPDLILLDLNMPKMNGIEFLRILKADERLKYIPAVIISTSNNKHDLKECYKIGIAGYIIKPLKYEDYTLKIEKMLSYWSENELFKL